MEEVSDLELINKVKNEQCSESYLTLKNRHVSLCLNMIRRYYAKIESTGVSQKDINEEQDMIIYKSILSFKPEKAVKFSTWLGHYTRYHCLNLMARDSVYIPVDDKDLQMKMDNMFPVEPETTEEDSTYIFNILDELEDKRVKEVFKHRYLDNSNPSWVTIGKKMNLSSQTVIDLHKKGKNLLTTRLFNTEGQNFNKNSLTSNVGNQ